MTLNATIPRVLLSMLGAAVPLIPLAVGLTITGSGGAGSARAAVPRYSAVSLTRSFPVAGTESALPPGPGALVAVVNRPLVLRTRPRGRTFATVSTRTEFGSPTVLWVQRRVKGWLGVVTPQAGNGRVGWIAPQAVTQHALGLARVRWQLRVSLSARRLTVVEADRVMKRYTVAIGAPDSPTPTGSFAVTDRLATGDPGGPYGCCILALSARAPHAIQDWGGGDRIAIHSTPETWSIGEAVSHGCMRLTIAEGQWLLDHVPLGTPALISS